MGLGELYSQNVFAVAQELKKKYKDFQHYNKKNPLDELIFILCSIKRSERVYCRAFKSLKQAYPSFAKLSQASEGELVTQVSWGGLQNYKAKTLRGLMNAITVKFGRPTLAPLFNMTQAECENFLCSLPGVGKKVARCVMLYSLNMKVYPVDTHCCRVSRRIGWLKSTTKNKFCSSVEMDSLQEMIPPKLRLSLHVNMISLGRDKCLAQFPKCSSCPISRYCLEVSTS